MYDLDRYFSKFPAFFDGTTFKNMFDTLSGDFSSFTTKCFPYPVNFYSEYDDKNIVKKTVLEIALAGFSKDEIKVQVDDKSLKVSIEKLEKNEDNDNKKYHSRGIAKRNASISYSVTSTADIENTNVTFKDGILKIVVPTKQEFIEKKQTKFLDIQ